MSDKSARDVLFARLARRLKILGGVVIALAVIGLGVYFVAPQWLLRGAIAWRAPGSLPNEGKVIEDARRYA